MADQVIQRARFAVGGQPGVLDVALDQATTFQHLADACGNLLDESLQLVRAGLCHRAEQRRALTPLELLDRLAALMPWPRRHRHHDAGVFAPHAALRARAPPELETEGAGTAALAFDQSPSWDPVTPPPDLGVSFDQTLA